MFLGGDDAGAGASPYFQQQQQQQQVFDHGAIAGPDTDGFGAFAGGGDEQCQALLYNLSVLREKVQLLHPLVGLAVHGRGGVPMAADAGAIIQEIVAAASSMMYAFQHLCATSAEPLQAPPPLDNSVAAGPAAGTATAAAGCSGHQLKAMEDHHGAAMQWQHGGFYDDGVTRGSKPSAAAAQEEEAPAPGTKTRIIELEAAELLAKYTHYCQVCGKGFKRDANLRMHMRAHGDQYKSKAALSAVVSSSGASSSSPAAAMASKYSCPQEGCRWNVRHARFTPLKSVICAKNHYRRSHCPKMYACNRCGRKQFSVLSDLRTHEKHCGDRRWLCSCGTTFSRKDKLAGHVSLFGHHPVVVGEGDRQCKIDRSSSANSDQLLGNCTTSAGGFSIT